MRSTEEQSWSSCVVLLQAATQGAIPTEGLLSRRFKPGNREQRIGEEYERDQLYGRLERKVEQLRARKIFF